MKSTFRMVVISAALVTLVGAAQAASDSDTSLLFRNSSQSAEYFQKSYGYAVFPTIGKGGLGIGAAHGTGHVYQQGKRIGRVVMNQISVGFQACGEGYSQIIFFEDKHALAEFTTGNFEFSADAGAIAITAAASVSAGTKGADASVSTEKKYAATAGTFNKGMAVFTVAKGGLMYNAALAGQKYSYHGTAVL